MSDPPTGSPVTRRGLLARAAAGLVASLRLGAVGLAGGLVWSGNRRAQAGRPLADEPERPDQRRHSVDPYRLPQHIVPTRYDIRLEPDLAAATFAGQETIAITVRQPTTEILLNAAELDVTEALVEGDAGSHRARVELDEATERCCLRLPVPLQPGAWRLRLSFTGKLNDKLRGFYRSTYKDEAGRTQVLAATQFEATDARRAFPCWDEPAFKAIFATTLVIDPELTAVSNTPIASETLERGKRAVRFADTIPMSTYLVAFVVGKLEATEPVWVGQTPVRIWCVPGKRRLAAFGQRIAAFSLQFFEEYYGLPYPAEKLDLLAIPDFASGAMENLGAITFRETALLVDERTATHAELERVADVVAHENAHMWFGDLVTMAWWNGLWLNEAFATFMEMLAVDAWKPEWRRWTAFGMARAAAFGVDGLHSTRPIEYPVRAPKDADAMFDVLTYEKGASVLRMLEQYLGPERFRAGIRDYLRTHAYGNADTGDLWTALARATGEPIPAMMDGWIFKPGYPLVSASLEQAGGDARWTLRLAQQRFTYLPASAAPPDPGGAGPASADSQRWHIPIQLRIMTKGQAETRRLLLTEWEVRLPLPAGFESVLVNEGGHGFYRVRYGPELWERLLPLVPERLDAIDRFNLVNDAWAAAVAGLLPVPDYLDITARFRGERDKNVWALLIESFAALNRIIDERDRPRLEALVRDRLGPAVAELGWAPRAGEDELTRQLRGDLLRAIGTLGNDAAVQARAAELYAEHHRAGAGGPSPVDPNVLPALVAILAHTGDAARYEEFRERFHTAATPQEERRYLFALAAFRSPALIEQTLARTLTDEIRTQDAPFLIHALLLSVSGRSLAWEFVKANWERLDARFPKNGLRRMCHGVVGLATPDWERDIQQFFAERKIDLGGKTLAQYLEQLRIAVALRERERSRLANFLSR
ncbi:M1 family metallopeptidase [Nitrospira sp. Kam-Ns4a]